MRSGTNLHSCTVCQMVPHFVSGGKKGVMQISPLFLPSRSRKGREGRGGPLFHPPLAPLAWVQIPLQITAAAAIAAMELFLSLFPARSAMEAIKLERNCRGFPTFIRVQAALMRPDGGGEFPLSIHMQYLSSSDVEGSIAFCSLLEFEPPLPPSPFTYSKAFWVHGFACLQG